MSVDTIEASLTVGKSAQANRVAPFGGAVL
jgi:hypothetical protein